MQAVRLIKKLSKEAFKLSWHDSCLIKDETSTVPYFNPIEDTSKEKL